MRQLVLCTIAMMAISSPQYVWTLFVKPLEARLGLGLAQVQVTFSLLVLFQSLCSPFQGFVGEKLGPRRLVFAGGLFLAASWLGAARAASPLALYLTYGVLGGIATGAVYIAAIGLMANWFPDRRGLAMGIVAAGYGCGAIFTTGPIAMMLGGRGLTHTLALVSVALGAVACMSALGLARAPAGLDAALAGERGGHPTAAVVNVSPAQMLKTQLFWLLFAMMSMMCAGGLMIVSQMAVFAADLGVAAAQVLGFSALPLALSIDRVANGLTRPAFGWLSDRIGRENTMALAFSFEALAVALFWVYGGQPLLFVAISGFAFFAWGEIFSLFPALLTDIFGTAHATANYGFLYLSFGVGSLIGAPLSGLIRERSGSWLPVFAAVVALNLGSAALALLALKPMRRRWRNDWHCAARPATPQPEQAA